MKIYLAGPFFNPAQVSLVTSLEEVIHASGHTLYSPRLHSGSDKMTPEDRKLMGAWTPVFQSNIEGMRTADLVIAILDYPYPEPSESNNLCTTQLGIMQTYGYTVEGTCPECNTVFKPIKLADTGTVFEVGYCNALQKTVLGFYSQKPEAVNLMLTHGVQGVIYGIEDFSRLFSGSDGDPTQAIMSRAFSFGELRHTGYDGADTVQMLIDNLNWTVVHEVEGVKVI